MKKIKKLGITALAAVLVVSAAGCGKKEEKVYKNSDIVMSVKDKNGDKLKIDYATACTYLRIMQAEAYSYMSSLSSQSNAGASDDVWSEAVPGDDAEYDTYGEQFKGESLDTLKTMILSEANQDEYDVEFTDEDQEKCDEAAKKFMQDNSDQSAEAMHASEKSVSNVLRLWTIEERVRAQIIKEADTEVTDEEAGQTTFNYAIVYKKEVDDPEKKAKELVDAMKDSTDFETAASNAKLTAQTVTFTTNDPEYDDYDKTMIENAEKLKDGECDTYENKDGKTCNICGHKFDTYDGIVSSWYNRKDGVSQRIDIFEDAGLIKPYTGKTNKAFNLQMDCLNDRLSKKDLGAFYTHPVYANLAARELVLPAANAAIKAGKKDYVILDRCAGTGNLESALIGLKDDNGDELISHCIVSTYEYWEYKVLNENIGDKVRHIIPSSEANVEYFGGKVLNADAMSEEYINNKTVRCLSIS